MIEKRYQNTNTIMILSKTSPCLLIVFILLFTTISCQTEEEQQVEIIEEEKIETFNLVISTSEGGSVNTQGGEFTSGESVTIIAEPNEFFQFINWSDGSTEIERTVTIENDISLTANFERIQYTLDIVMVQEGGIVTEGGLFDAGSEIIIEAESSYGWEFSHWSGDINTDENPKTILITSDITIEANFLYAIYLDDNQLTLKARDFAEVGSSYDFEGNSYKIVDYQLLKSMVENDENVELVVTTKVGGMYEMFKSKVDFNQNISRWDTSNVTEMGRMFMNAENFNQDISYWNTSNVGVLTEAFMNAKKFNQDIGNWDVSRVGSFSDMFNSATDFNQDIGQWDTSMAQDFFRMFWNASSFNQDISLWNTAKVGSMGGMFRGASNFNQDLTNWCVTKILSEPSGDFPFSMYSNLSQNNKPKWGTCPN